MSVERIKQSVERILTRVATAKGLGEEATKQALVLPMLEALGWDIWNPQIVQPEFESDTAIKKSGQKEKVDYAILQRGVPRIFIEVKAIDVVLDGHHGQLKRYFNSTPSVTLAILTNGIEYRFYTDTTQTNIQDEEPFFIARLDALEQGLQVLARFQAESFSGEGIREYATELTYTSRLVDFLGAQIDIRDGLPSEDFVRWILRQPAMYGDGRITASVVETFRPSQSTWYGCLERKGGG